MGTEQTKDGIYIVNLIVRMVFQLLSLLSYYYLLLPKLGKGIKIMYKIRKNIADQGVSCDSGFRISRGGRLLEFFTSPFLYKFHFHDRTQHNTTQMRDTERERQRQREREREREKMN